MYSKWQIIIKVTLYLSFCSPWSWGYMLFELWLENVLQPFLDHTVPVAQHQLQSILTVFYLKMFSNQFYDFFSFEGINSLSQQTGFNTKVRIISLITLMLGNLDSSHDSLRVCLLVYNVMSTQSASIAMVIVQETFWKDRLKVDACCGGYQTSSECLWVMTLSIAHSNYLQPPSVK